VGLGHMSARCPASEAIAKNTQQSCFECPTRTSMKAYGNVVRTAEQQYGAAGSPLDTYRKGLPGWDTPERRSKG